MQVLRWRVAALVVMTASVCGCASSIRETHYFQTQTSAGAVPNYYRLSIEASSKLSSARYLSGYFDEEVVNQYFNEIGQPQAARLVPLNQLGDGSAASETSVDQSKKTLATAGRNPSLVMLMSTNSDDISNQLGALSQSQQFTDALVRVLAPRRFDAASETERALGLDQAQGKSLVVVGEQLTTDLAGDLNPQANQARLTAYFNQLAADLGAPPFKSLAEARKWLDANRVHIVARSGT